MFDLMIARIIETERAANALIALRCGCELRASREAHRIETEPALPCDGHFRAGVLRALTSPLTA